MSAGDKISNAAQEMTGKAKEAAGRVTGNERLEAEGKIDQGKAHLKKVAEDVKDSFDDDSAEG